MRLLVLSDLHVEFAPFDAAGLDRGRFDAVVLAGDIHQGVAAIQWARESFPRHPIVQVTGNHEFYGEVQQHALAAMREAAGRLDVMLLENDAIEFGGVTFAGCTGWTDFRLYERGGRPRAMSVEEAMVAARRRIIDFDLVRWADADAPEGVRDFRPADSVSLHRRSRQWLTEHLSRPVTGKRVVVTHHLPSWFSVSPEFAAADTNPGFASDLDDLFPGVAVWIHGHTHSSHDYFAAGTRVVCNPRGYPWRGGGFENPRFEPLRIVEV
jgi:predicted phosphodiesterase